MIDPLIKNTSSSSLTGTWALEAKDGTSWESGPQRTLVSMQYHGPVILCQHQVNGEHINLVVCPLFETVSTSDFNLWIRKAKYSLVLQPKVCVTWDCGESPSLNSYNEHRLIIMYFLMYWWLNFCNFLMFCLYFIRAVCDFVCCLSTDKSFISDCICFLLAFNHFMSL